VATAELLSINRDQLLSFRVSERPEPLNVKASDLVRWGNPLPPKAQMLVLLVDGGQLVTSADWSGGAAVQFKGDTLVVKSDTWNEVKLPKSAVLGIVFDQRRRADEREQIAERLRRGTALEESAVKPAATNSDAIYLTNGDRLSGAVAAIEGGSLKFTASAGQTNLPLSRLEAIRFGSVASSGSGRKPQRDNEEIIVGTRDGSLLMAQKILAESDTVTIETRDGIKLSGAKIADLVTIQSLGGGFEYLSDIEKADYRSVPYLSVEWPLARDQNVLRGPLMVNGKRYLKGLGMHSAARLSVKFEHPYRRFDAEIALDDAAGDRGSVVFSVYVDRDGKWVEAFKSDVVRGGDSPQYVSVDLAGAKALTLTVDYADRGDEMDYANWLNARLVR